MHILFVIPYVPNQIRVRPYNLIRSLAERDNEVTVLTLQSSEAEATDVDHLRQLVKEVIVLDLPRWRSFWNCLQVVPSRQPLQSAYCWQPALAEVLAGLVQERDGRAPFDVVHVEHLRGVRYAQYLKQLNAQVPVVWDSVDCISFLFEQAVEQSKSGLGRLMTRLDLGRTRHFEATVVDQFDQVLVTSPADRDAFSRLRAEDAPLPPITVLPNGVDLDAFRPDPTIRRAPETIVVTGKMSYHANVTMVLHLAQQIMPFVWQAYPQARLQIVGKDPSPAIQKLAEHVQVEVTGTVPAIEPYLQAAAISVAPIPYGAGIQNKVLEAMACATPTVVTSQAAKALSAVAGEEFLVADEPQDFAGQIIELLDNEQRREQIGRNGRRFVERNHDWHQIAARLEAIYASLAKATAV